MTTDTITESGAPDSPGGRFAKPAPQTAMQSLAWREAERREDDPPPEVPRDQWERPIIVLPDGSGAISYIRASKYGKLIRDQRKLIKWDERNIVFGMSRAHHLVARASGVRTLTAGPDMSVLEEIAEQAKTVAGAHAGAMSGSGMHALHARRLVGEDLSWLDPTLMACLDAITALLDPRIFEVLCTEGDDDLGRTFIVHDGLRGAGSFDLVVRLLVDLTWPDGVTIPAGTIMVVDLKTGKITSGPYWSTEFSCQQLIYAEGLPYRAGVTHLADPKVRSVKNVIKVTDQPGHHGRITWDEIGIPGGPDQRYSLILHVPVTSPADAHWERVNLDEARADAEVAKGAHARAKVDRAGRFLALPAAALIVPGVDLPAAVDLDAPPVDTPASTSSQDHFNPKLHETLLQRIGRADSTDKVDQIYDSWGQSPTWDDELTAACQAVYDRIDPGPAVIDSCEACNHDTHRCPGCGAPTAHGVAVCPACSLRVALEEAPDRATISVLWDAHGPDGDKLWAEEHQAAGIARYRELPAMDGWPDLDETGEVDAAEDDGGDAQAPEGTCATHGPHPDTIMCQGCIDDQRHATAVAQQGAVEATYDAAADPEHPITAAADAAGVFQGPDDDPAGPPVNPVNAESGPFDRTMDLADLRDKIEQALDTDTLDALYDAHCAVEEGGDGLWTDDLNAVAQAAYDRLSTGTEVPT